MKFKDQQLLEEAYENLLQKSSSDDLFQSLNSGIPENTTVEDLAIALARIIKDEYGSHNIEPFLKHLQDNLKN